MSFEITLWTPSKVLQLGSYSPEKSSTCVGHASSQNRRCRNPIAVANRHRASELLDQLSELDLFCADRSPLLQELASKLLCRRWHQDQAATVVRRWQENITDWKIDNMVGRLKLHTRQVDRATRNWIPPPTRPAVAITNATPPPSNTTEVSRPRQRLSRTVAPAKPKCLDCVKKPVLLAARAESPGAISLTNVETLDCPICCDSLLLPESTALKCKHRFHTLCIEKWFETQLDREVPVRTCPYCRSNA